MKSRWSAEDEARRARIVAGCLESLQWIFFGSSPKLGRAMRQIRNGWALPLDRNVVIHREMHGHNCRPHPVPEPIAVHPVRRSDPLQMKFPLCEQWSVGLRSGTVPPTPFGFADAQRRMVQWRHRLDQGEVRKCKKRITLLPAFAIHTPCGTPSQTCPVRFL